jgi:hypothetical protein
VADVAADQPFDELTGLFAALREDIDSVPNAHDADSAKLVAELLEDGK